MNSLIYSETIDGISLIEVTDFFQLKWSENKTNQREKKIGSSLHIPLMQHLKPLGCCV